MSHNKSRKMQRAAHLLDQVLWIDRSDPHALPGSAVRLIKLAKKTLTADIRKRRDGRNRESLRRSGSETRR